MDRIAAGNYPPHIAALDVGEKYKRAFTLYEGLGVTQPGGLFPALPKPILTAWKKLPFKERRLVNKYLLTTSFGAYFFNGFYYMYKGMWRKGIAVLCGSLAVGLAASYVYLDILGLYQYATGLAAGVGAAIEFMVGVAASYDLYRSKVRKEQFWW